MTQDAEREAFEKFAGIRISELVTGSHDHAQWCAWQARAALAPRPLSKADVEKAAREMARLIQDNGIGENWPGIKFLAKGCLATQGHTFEEGV